MQMCFAFLSHQTTEEDNGCLYVSATGLALAPALGLGLGPGPGPADAVIILALAAAAKAGKSAPKCRGSEDFGLKCFKPKAGVLQGTQPVYHL